MQQFIVPQFIDVESKIIGPLTVRQFITFIVGAGLIFIVFKLATFWIAAIEGLIIFGLTGVFAFMKINGRPFHYFLINLFQTVKRPTMKIWSKSDSSVKEKKQKEKKEIKEVFIPKKQLTESRLSKLSLIVDTGGSYQDDLDE